MPRPAGPDAQPARACILEVSALDVRYGRRVALEDVSFELGRGERVAVVGPNGAGKSTLFKAVAGLLSLSSGRITVHGHAPGVGKCVAYVQQRSAVDWSFPISVAAVVMMARVGRIGMLRRPSAADRALVANALATVGLTELAGRQIGELSGGQQQRMFIARALAQEAELVLMDEPLTGLDARSRQGILAVLDTLREQSVGVMVATHDLELAARDFDRVMLLNRRLFGLGPPHEVLTEPNLMSAYSGSVRVLDTGETVVGDVGREGPHDGGHG